jgi:anti-sigma factor (TIGR02949 family)
MSRLTCTETFRRLDDYLDRELSAKELADVEEHLEACANCAGEFQVERELIAGIRDKLRRVRAPGGLLERVMRSLPRE